LPFTFSSTLASEAYSCKFTKIQSLSNDFGVSCELSKVVFNQRALFDVQINKTAIEIALEVDEDYIENEFSNEIVKDLKFKASKLTKIPENVFEIFKKLENFHAPGSELRFLTSQTFKGAQNLLSLYLQNNQISKIENEVFNNLEQLQVLDLSSNQIVKVKAKAFSSLEALEDLNLSNNKISDLDDEVFENLKNLKSIGLENNHLTIIPSKLFTEMHKNLSTISLSFNEIHEISPHIFDNLKSLKFLFLTGNKCIDKSFNNYVIPGNVPIKYELAKCFSNYQKIFHSSEDNFNITKTLIDVRASKEICDYENLNLKKGLEEMEKQLLQSE
jgi:Leucine-rich repeat (LRR) protein